MAVRATGCKIDAVFFDVDDTLYSTTGFSRRAREHSIDAMLKLGLRCDRDRLLAELYEVVTEFSSNYDRHYEQLLERIPARCYASVNPAVLVGAAVAAYHDAKVREFAVFPDVKRVMPKLARSGILLGVITDGLAVKQAEKLVRLGILKYLDPRAVFISDQVGIGKPNPKLFRLPLSRLHLKAARTVFVGDRPDKDIAPAASVGMITVRSVRPGKYADLPDVVTPDHAIHDFNDFTRVLRDEYGVPMSRSAGRRS